MEQGLTLHATVENLASRRKKGGGRTYKLTFSYPRGFLRYVDEFYDASVDLFWNEELIASSTKVGSGRQKPQKDTDPLYLVTFDCDGADTALTNMADKVDSVGDLRLAVTQLAMNLP